MKIVLSFLLATFVMVMPVQAIPGDPPVVDGPRITVNIEFGLPIICTAWGICHWDITASDQAASMELQGGGDGSEGGGVSGGGSGGGGGGSWILRIPRTYLLTNRPETLKYFEGQSSVSFPDTYVAPQSIKNALGSFKDLIIQKNSTYPLKFVNGEYVITVPL